MSYSITSMDESIAKFESDRNYSPSPVNWSERHWGERIKAYYVQKVYTNCTVWHALTLRANKRNCKKYLLWLYGYGGQFVDSDAAVPILSSAITNITRTHWHSRSQIKLFILSYISIFYNVWAYNIKRYHTWSVRGWTRHQWHLLIRYSFVLLLFLSTRLNIYYNNTQVIS